MSEQKCLPSTGTGNGYATQKIGVTDDPFTDEKYDICFYTKLDHKIYLT